MVATKALRLYCELGATGFMWRLSSYAYKNLIRPLLPNGQPILYANVLASHRKVGDGILSKLFQPPSTEDVPEYEEALVKSLHEHVKPNDKVVVVGVGKGVTCVIAASWRVPVAM